MKLFFLSTSSSSTTTNGTKKNRKEKKKPSLSRSDTPSFSSSTSSDPSTTPKTVLKTTLTSSLDPEFCNTSVATSSSIHRGNDGKVTREELELVLRHLGGRGEDVTELLAVADRDGDGRISLEELLLTRAEVKEEATEEELRLAFEVYDKNGDGKISADDLLKVFEMLGDDSCSIEDCRRMIGGVDSDGDGLVCFSDFSSMMSMNPIR